MDTTSKVVIGSALGILILVGVIYAFSQKGGTQAGPGPLDAFAQCLGEKGAKFYGAFWCPHCQNQKKLFGSSERYLPYIECSTANGQGRLPVCEQANIEGYPTWEFADGPRLSGEVPLETLAENTGCELPEIRQ